MAITADLKITIAEVEVNDDYRVVLSTHRKVTDYAPDEAIRLGRELIDAGSEAMEKLRADFPRDIARHGFDVDMAGEAP